MRNKNSLVNFRGNNFLMSRKIAPMTYQIYIKQENKISGNW